jgi:hypothetical protein
MRRLVFAATVSAAALLAGASLAQTPQLRAGEEVRGVLDANDPVTGDDYEEHRYDDYRFTARRGQRLEAVLRSEDFDAFLQVFGPGDGLSLVGEDDDSLGEGTNARLRFTAPENGAYTLRARTFSGTEGGDYVLSLAQRPDAPRAPRPTAIRTGAEVRGSISDRDPEDDAGGRRYDAYSFRASANQRVAVSLDSEAFDPQVYIGQMAGQNFVELASNDDGPNGLGSYLIFTAPRSGDYVIRAMPLSEGEGDYVLKLEDGPPPLRATAIQIGGSVEGALSADDGLNDSGQRADVYSFTAPDGLRIEAKAASDDFDTYLELFDADGQSIAQDDDGAGEGTNSRLSKTLTAGRYTIQVRALGDGTGDYSFSLGEGAPPPQAVPLAYATEVRGEIKDEGGRDDEGRVYDAYSFSGQAGTRVQVVMRSGDFDTYLQLFSAGGSEALASDDDGLGEGTDSRLNFILPETGDYVIQASPLGSSSKGLYSIELTDRGPQPEPGSILIGATARGTLSDNDGLAESGAYFDGYRVNVAAGDKLIVTMVSNDFDAFIDIGRDEDGTWETVISDDDGLADTNAKVEWTVEEAGTYVIRARSYAGGSTGSYALTVDRRP